MCPGGVEAPPREQQVANDTIAQIALQARDSAESGDQSQAQFRKTESRHLVRDDEIAHQRQLETSTEGHSLHSRNRGQRRAIDRVQHAVNAFQKVAHPGHRLRFLHLMRALIEFPKIRTRTEARFQGAVNDKRMGLPRHAAKRIREFF